MASSGGGTYAVHELQPGGELPGPEGGGEGLAGQAPAGEPGFGEFGGGQLPLGISHGAIMAPEGRRGLPVEAPRLEESGAGAGDPVVIPGASFAEPFPGRLANGAVAVAKEWLQGVGSAVRVVGNVSARHAAHGSALKGNGGGERMRQGLSAEPNW